MTEQALKRPFGNGGARRGAAPRDNYRMKGKIAEILRRLMVAKCAG
jgi:hypothetical protein